MALVHHDVTVVRNEVFDDTFALQALLRESHAEMPTKQRLLEVCEIFFNRGVREQDSDPSHYDRHQEYKIN